MSDGKMAIYIWTTSCIAALNVFERSNSDFGVNAAVQTNEKGMATVKVKNDRTYLIDNVILRPASVKLSKDKGIVGKVCGRLLHLAL